MLKKDKEGIKKIKYINNIDKFIPCGKERSYVTIYHMQQ